MEELYKRSNIEVEQSLNALRAHCEEEGFVGWDPYDGLNSRVFRFLRLNRVAVFRLAWIQLFKRNPWNLRRLFLVPKGYNPKGLGLFLSAYSKRLIALKNTGREVPTELESRIEFLADRLIDLRSKGYSGSCWGYNFDWQARGGLFFPSGTPTVVATTYAACGLFDAFEATKNEKYKETALDSVHFVMNDLNRSHRANGTFLFSYSAVNGNNTVYNASLLGSKLLARAFAYNADKNLLAAAKKSVMAVMDAQEKDGSWVYGELPLQNWKDSFHTGFNLECLNDYMKYSKDESIREGVLKGLEFYLTNFFTEEGVPKYYHDRTYPIDIHSPAQLVVTLDNFGMLDDYRHVLDPVVNWTIANMQDDRGHFYYQIKSNFTTKIPYMRWSQAWMMHALTIYLNHHESTGDSSN